jgi:two-component system response regulator PilR (NtrC family)
MSVADILIVDDEPDLRELYQLALVHEGYSCDAVGSVAEARAALARGRYRLAIVDMRLGDGNGMDLLRMVQQAQRSERVVVATAYGSADNAVEALKAGAFDYLSKPVDLRQLRLVVKSALAGTRGEPTTTGGRAAARDDADGRGAASGVREPHPGAAGVEHALSGLIGISPAMSKLREMIRKVAASMAPVLIEGESGSGKELIARAVHQASPRSGGPFVPVNCGAIPQDLLEAEFFGYRKGAFTGASTDREGFFQAAEGGTLFLDEVAELPLAMQAKLLRALQERRVRRVGDTVEVPVDVRIVSATHQPLQQLVAAGKFRQDLYYRLNVIALPVPPLRARIEDIGLLAEHILARIAAESGRRYVLSDAAVAALQSYDYPGNVRELENILHRACALATGEVLREEDLAFNTVTAVSTRAHAGATSPDFLPSDMGVYIDSVERDVIERALRRTRFNRTEAAQLLGLTLRQMRYRMARLGIGSGERSDEGDETEASR